MFVKQMQQEKAEQLIYRTTITRGISTNTGKGNGSIEVRCWVHSNSLIYVGDVERAIAEAWNLLSIASPAYSIPDESFEENQIIEEDEITPKDADMDEFFFYINIEKANRDHKYYVRGRLNSLRVVGGF
jgi:hypothetical protein